MTSQDNVIAPVSKKLNPGSHPNPGYLRGSKCRSSLQQMPQNMVVNKTQTARFSEVVDACGTPEAFVPWTPLEKNKDFVNARRENRLMTIKQEPVGTKKDFGVVGLIKGKTLTYLIFPKPLTRFENHRIVGIKYELVK